MQRYELLEKIQNAIWKSKIAEKLWRTKRWTNYWSGERSVAWLDKLGPTAIVLIHQEYFIDFIENWGASSLSSDDLDILLLAASIHDLGEGETGDKADPEKNEEDDLAEAKAAIAVIQSLALEETLITRLIAIYTKVVAGEDKKLYGIFRALEKTEHLDTGILVYRNWKNKSEHSLSEENTRAMIRSVLDFTLPMVLEFAKEYPDIVGNYLREHKEEISGMIELVQGNASEWEGFLERYKGLG